MGKKLVAQVKMCLEMFKHSVEKRLEVISQTPQNRLQYWGGGCFRPAESRGSFPPTALDVAKRFAWENHHRPSRVACNFFLFANSSARKIPYPASHLASKISHLRR